MTAPIEPYRRPPPRVVVHHVHHVRVEHHDAGSDDTAELRWQLKVVMAAYIVPTLVVLVLLAMLVFEIAMRAGG